MAALFDVDVHTINEHLKNIFINAELEERSVIRKFRTTANDGKNYNVQFYNLDAIISVGYRVNSIKATQLDINGFGIRKSTINQLFFNYQHLYT